MFDQTGRIADETPFVVEWFVRNGIRVWNTQEGEQRFDNHTDKSAQYYLNFDLTPYIEGDDAAVC